MGDFLLEMRCDVAGGRWQVAQATWQTGMLGELSSCWRSVLPSHHSTVVSTDREKSQETSGVSLDLSS